MMREIGLRLTTILCCLLILKLDSARPLVAQDAKSNTQGMIELLRSGADPNGLDENGLPRLLAAWQEGDTLAFEVLLEMGANPHQLISVDQQIELDNKTILLRRHTPILGIIVQHAKIRLGFVELALRYMRLPNQVDADGRSIMHHLANNPGRLSVSLLKLMVNNGVDPNCLDNNRLNAPRVFVRKFVEINDETLSSILIIHATTIFVMHGSDLMTPASDGTTLADDVLLLETLHPKALTDVSALVENFPTVAQRLRNYAKDNLLRKHSTNSPLLQPMFPDSPRLLTRKVMLTGVDSNIRGTAGLTPLWLAVHCNLESELKSLLRDGADPDLRLTDDLRKFAAKTDEIYGIRGEDDGYFGTSGETVVMAACTNPFWRDRFIPLLITASKEPNQTDQLGRNLLHRLLYHPLLIGQEHLVNVLVKAGVDLNAQTISGSTPTHVAVALNPKVIPTLVALGADPNIRDIHNRTVEDLLTVAIRDGWPRQDDYQKSIAWLRENRK